MRAVLMRIVGDSICPFIGPAPLSGSTGEAKIAFTTSIPSTTRPNRAKLSLKPGIGPRVGPGTEVGMEPKGESGVVGG